MSRGSDERQYGNLLMTITLLTAFLQATRPRTYPLALVGILVANALAFSRLESFTPQNWQIFFLSMWVALGLQILSNLANDYGDGIRGTDNHRLDRQISQGNLKPQTLKHLIKIWAAFIFACGVGLLWLSFDRLSEFLTFLAFGVIAIIAAVTYTMGKRPYGYQAKGEIAVFIFFGLLNVLGGLYLQTQYIGTTDIIAAITIGLLCTCVLMINNMRDIDNDVLTGKQTLATRLGKENMGHLYRIILLAAYFLVFTFSLLQQNFYLVSLIIIINPVFKHLKTIRQYSDETIQPAQLSAQLKQIILITLITSALMSLSLVQTNHL